MLVNSIEKPDIIEVSKGEKLTIASTYEMIKNRYELGQNYKSIKVKIYNNFFVVTLVDTGGKTTNMAFSDTWDFSVM